MKFIPLTIVILLATQLCMSQTQSEMNNQAKIAHQRADQEMTKVYKTVMSSLSSQIEKNQLLEVQRAWIKYKESHCKALANQYQGGSMYPLILYSCLEEITIERKKQLKKYLDN
jgi:uncharacterized protein YecT (DUF1311 family)